MGIVLAGIALLLLLIVLSVGGRSADQQPRHTLPRELQGAKLFLCEPKENIATLKPFPLHGRPDEVYERDGELVVLDTKTRSKDRIYKADVVKLSGYAAILRNGDAFKRYRCAPHGFIRLVNRDTGWVSFHRVALLSDAELIKINNRRLALRAGQADPRFSSNRQYCRGCGQRQRCTRVAA